MPAFLRELRLVTTVRSRQWRHPGRLGQCASGAPLCLREGLSPPEYLWFHPSVLMSSFPPEMADSG